MLKTMRLISVAAAAALALPALAGSWPPIAPRKATSNPPVAAAPATAVSASVPAGSFEAVPGEAGWRLVQPEYAYQDGKYVLRNAAPAPYAAAKAATGTVAGFEPADGEAGWQLAQHRYDFVAGKFVMSDECDHAIRIATAPTPAELEVARSLQSGG